MSCPGCRAQNPDAATRCLSCGRELGRRSVGPGSLVASRYELLAELGAGGMGTVYKAHDRSLDEVVALKVLKGDVSGDRGLAQRFRSEVKLAWRVRDRNVCGIHEYGEDGELLYISMELVEGRDLKAILRDEGALSWEEAFDVALQTTAGLQAIHQAGVIHRDLKPANITRDASGLVRLMDFGIAKAFGLEAANSLTRTGQVVGSPEYMSPEQWRGQELDFRSDIYALGVTIYEMFTGHPPFQAESPAALMVKHLQSPPLLHGPQASRIPPALVPVLGRALAKEPAERYATCRQMLAALRSAREALGSEATDDLASEDPGDDEVSTVLVDRERVPALASSPRRPAPSGPRPAVHSRYAKLLVPALTRALTHERAPVRTGAAEALARIGADASPAAEALSRAASDTDTDVRNAAAAALEQLGPAKPPSAPAEAPPAEPTPAPGPAAAIPSDSTGWTVPPPVRPPPPPPMPSPAQRAPREPPSGRPREPRSFPTRPVAILSGLAAVAVLVLLFRPGTTPGPGASTATPVTTLTLPPAPTPVPTAAVVETAPLPPPTSPPAPQPTAVPIPTPVPSSSSSPSPRPRPTTVAISPPTTAAPPPPVTTLPPASVAPDPTPAPVVAPSPEATAAVSPPSPAPSRDVVVLPQCVRCPPPPYPEIAQRLGLKGRVRLRLDVDEKGIVGRVVVLEGPRELAEGAAKAIKKWTYRPATRNGVPTPFPVEVPLDFQ